MIAFSPIVIPVPLPLPAIIAFPPLLHSMEFAKVFLNIVLFLDCNALIPGCSLCQTHSVCEDCRNPYLLEINQQECSCKRR